MKKSKTLTRNSNGKKPAHTSVDKMRDDQLVDFSGDPKSTSQLPLIADEIHVRLKQTKENIYEIGRLLAQAKIILPHGEFQSWIEDNFDISYQTANNFMNVYLRCANHPEYLHGLKPSVLYGICSSKFPEKWRNTIIEHSNQMKPIKNKDIKELYERYDRGEITVDGPEFEEFVGYRMEKDQYACYQRQLEQCFATLESVRDYLSEMASKLNWPILSDKDKTELTDDSLALLQRQLSDIRKQVDLFCPEYAIVSKKDIKPKFSLSGKHK